MLKDQSGLSPLDVPDKNPSDAATAVVGTSLPHPVPSKPESVFSLASQCSYSSTIVHVGDKKSQLDSGTVVCVCGVVGGGIYLLYVVAGLCLTARKSYIYSPENKAQTGQW